jgi:two-component system, OmpR family, phosphate regulon sensor histidine kinase PhoR
MLENVSFRTLLIVSWWGLLLLALIFPSWYSYTRLEDEIRKEAREGLIRQLDLVCSLMAQHEEFQGPEQLQNWLGQIANPLDLRLTYVAKSGQVLADSQVPFDQVKDLEDFSGRPEISQALHEEIGFTTRFSKIMQRDQLFAAKGIQPKGKIPAGVIRAAGPVAKLQDLVERLRKLFFVIVPLTFLVTGWLSCLLIRRLNRNLGAVVQTIDTIAAGDTRQRIHFTPGDELHPLADAVNRMAENTGRRFLALRTQQQELEAVFNAMREGVMVLGASGRIQSVNRALSELLGTQEKVLGRRPLEVVLSLELQEACDRLLTSTDPRSESPFYLPILVGDGRSFEVNIVRLPGGSEDAGAVVVFHDMSRLKHLEKVRQDFVANVSHELHTPLTSIKGYTETLLAEPQPEAEVFASFLEIILKNTNHMVKMVDDLLQLARIEARQEAFKAVPVDPTEALMAAWKTCLPVAQAKQVTLVNLISEEGTRVSADFDQLVRVFRNLLENGIRYSPEGGTITVEGHPEGHRVTFGVRDEGPGIPKQHQQRIFERFYRVERNRGSDVGSTGLGLAICRHIMLNHGGRIWVQSPNPGRPTGATFYFSMVSAEEQ